ncbi:MULTISPECIES: hypothetical protein [unclassified Paenibacillus]|uniref:phosphoribosyltransferase-like protein n=1 Tax=unclassified Paenibacillus TaxID=185978 RepID=UPI00020D7988|nr:MULTISPECIES: hypothetical protein [unclassified Paenibacillus]EGL14950.1 hypothetical protein HMPREF9413_1247 [Paenibacillus sp. HGF7]EPD92521.1 hypothetical protein HMPREF1207_00292 [Paenibacillus sp. HGH0039]
MNINEVAQVFIEKYGQEELYTKDIESKLVSWLENTSLDEIKEILLHLFSEFIFFTKRDIKELMKSQLIDVLNSYPLEDICIIPMVSKDGRANSSFDLTMLLKEVIKENGIELYKDTIKVGLDQIDDDITTLIFFDDISGSGGTIVSFLKENESELIGRKIIIRLIVITETAHEVIDKYLANQTELDVTVIAEFKYDKVFKNHKFLNDSHRLLINDFEETIWGKGNNNVMGFRDSQLLVGFSHNIPNNTISSFWYHTDFSGKREEWNSLFKRYTQLNRKNKKKTRSNQNLSVKREGGGSKIGL